MNIKRNLIEVDERVGPDPDDLLQLLAKNGLGIGIRGRIEQDLEQHSQFEPVLRFILVDAEARTYAVERMGYSGRGGWLDVYASGQIERLARKWVLKLGTTALFESFGPD